MNVLILSTFVSGGGAAAAAYKQLEALHRVGVPARMLVAAPLTGSDDCLSIRSVGGMRWRLFRYLEKLGTLLRVKDRSLLFRFSDATLGVEVADHPWVKWADVVHIHWVQQSFLSFSGLHSLLSLSDKRFFWTLHDLWPITGGCHSPYVVGVSGTTLCGRFLQGCGECPLLPGQVEENYTRHHFDQKRRLPLDRVHFLGVSRPIVELAQKSPLIRRVSYLPNFYDPVLFSPVSGKRANEASFRLLFVAARPDDPVKGPELLRDVLDRCCCLSESFRSRAVLVCIGRPKRPEVFRDWPISLESHGAVLPEELAEYYRTSALTLSTSRHETFGLTLLESQACGTPVCAFAVGGIPDVVPPESLVTPYDTLEFAQRILSYFDRQKGSATSSPVTSVERFSQQVVLPKLLALYEAEG